jgi:lysine-N-methylase
MRGFFWPETCCHSIVQIKGVKKMSNLSRTAAMPGFMTRFQCIGSECSDTCCAGWQVDIDKATYKKMRNLPSSELATKARKFIHIVPEPNDKKYARIQLDSDLFCPMLTEQMMCSVQQEAGVDHLSMVCRDYPRQYTALGENTQLLASLSCPEAARLCLTDEQGWTLQDELLNIPMGKKIPYIAGQTGGWVGSLNYKVRNFHLLQDFALKVVQHRGLYMWQRLLLVGLTCERIEKMERNGAIDEQDRALEHVLLQAQLAMLDGSFAEQTKDLGVQESARVAQQVFVKRMTDERLMMGVNHEGVVRMNTTFLNCVGDAFAGIDYDVDDLASTSERLTVAVQRFDAFDAQHPHILENYVSNTLALDVFPISKDKSLPLQWQDLMIRYAMVRFYLVGMAAKYQDEFSMDHCVKLIYSYSKTVQHNSQFLPRIHEVLQQEKLDNMATMAILIR